MIRRILRILVNVVLSIWNYFLYPALCTLMKAILMQVGWLKPIKFYKRVLGNDKDSHKDFVKKLDFHLQLEEVLHEDQSDVIIAFVPIVSRAGTDIDAALPSIPDNRPVILVALHHTFDPDQIVPDSRRSVERINMFVVDCLFHEDKRLLQCPRNTKALEETADYLKPMCLRIPEKVKFIREILFLILQRDNPKRNKSRVIVARKNSVNIIKKKLWENQDSKRDPTSLGGLNFISKICD